MSTFWQYTKARLGLWKPKAGEIYRPDVCTRPDPFKSNARPFYIEVINVKDGFVQFEYPSGNLESCSIDGFASYYLKVKK